MSDQTTTGQRNWLNLALWGAQILLAIGFGMAGYMKTMTPLPELGQMMSWVNHSSPAMVRFIGVVELLGAAGMILPAATRILPWLTPLAALGFAVIQVLAIGVHANLGETSQTLPINLVLLGLSLFVMWGRWKRSPILAK
jgi:uncharacterized membrane protein YphA (DoxX/SURF4 family)